MIDCWMYIYILQGLKCIYKVFKIIQHMYVTYTLYDMYMSFKDICCMTNMLLKNLSFAWQYMLV